MGLVFNNYIKNTLSDKTYINYPMLAHQNIMFLKSLNLKFAPGGRSRLWYFAVFKKMTDILGIQEGVVFDESITNYEIHTLQPYNSSNFNNSDGIRISIQN